MPVFVHVDATEHHHELLNAIAESTSGCQPYLVSALWCQVLAAQLLLDSVRGYNALAELAPLCPMFMPEENLIAADLPALLSVQWNDCVPTLQPIPFDAGAGRHCRASTFTCCPF